MTGKLCSPIHVEEGCCLRWRSAKQHAGDGVLRLLWCSDRRWVRDGGVGIESAKE